MNCVKEPPTSALTTKQEKVIKDAFYNDIAVGREIIVSLSKTKGKITDQLEKDLKVFFETEKNYVEHVVILEVKKAIETTTEALKTI